jgi:holo-[acyl-carrier protein] synthase
MDIVGIGSDVVECLRIGRMIEQHGELFLARIYTEREVLLCQGRRRSIEHFAARWAAKEAVMRALGAPWRRGLEWTDIEVREGDDGVPQVHLGGAVRELAEQRGVSNIHLTLAYCRAYATATALAVKGT